MADFISSQWAFPDHGIWEIPDRRRHYVHSKVMCWVGLDRAERIAQQLGMQADFRRWQDARESIQRAVLGAGYSNERESFVQTLEGADVDATALTFMQTGFIKPNDARAESTVQTIRKLLSTGRPCVSVPTE